MVRRLLQAAELAEALLESAENILVRNSSNVMCLLHRSGSNENAQCEFLQFYE